MGDGRSGGTVRDHLSTPLALRAPLLQSSLERLIWIKWIRRGLGGAQESVLSEGKDVS